MILQPRPEFLAEPGGAAEGRDFNPAVRTLTHRAGKLRFPAVPPLPEGEGPGVRGAAAPAGLKPRPSQD
ncbi:MAG: hypothetical protein ACRD18_08540, partial [Terriglobia bacterium]